MGDSDSIPSPRIQGFSILVAEMESRICLRFCTNRDGSNSRCSIFCMSSALSCIGIKFTIKPPGRTRFIHRRPPPSQSHKSILNVVFNPNTMIVRAEKYYGFKNSYFFAKFQESRNASAVDRWVFQPNIFLALLGLAQICSTSPGLLSLHSKGIVTSLMDSKF